MTGTRFEQLMHCEGLSFCVRCRSAWRYNQGLHLTTLPSVSSQTLPMQPSKHILPLQLRRQVSHRKMPMQSQKALQGLLTAHLLHPKHTQRPRARHREARPHQSSWQLTSCSRV